MAAHCSFTLAAAKPAASVVTLMEGYAAAASLDTSSRLRPGISVGAGRFTLTRELGRGGMGEVWLAQNERLREPVALKFLPAEIRGDPVALDDLRRETARSHKLAHPNIVRIHDLHEPAGEGPFISMEYVDGPTLSELRLRQPGRVLSWELLHPLVAQLCAALAYAHSEGVIHRDLKPSNLMVDGKGRLKLADFGIAAVVSDSVSRVSMQGTSGTLSYMSPQQLAGKRPTVADDIYALGATLYELLSGRPPFYTGDLTYQVMHELPPALEERLAELGVQNAIPAEVSAQVMACLAKDPAQRPANALEVAAGAATVVSAAAPQPIAHDESTSESPAESPRSSRIRQPEVPDQIEQGASDSAGEEVLWQGKPAFWACLPGLSGSAVWCAIWLYVARSFEPWIPAIQPNQTPDVQSLLRGLSTYAPKIRWVFYGFAALAVWGALRRVAQYLCTEFHITIMRIKVKTGVSTQRIKQVDIGEVKEVEAFRPLLGRFLNYADIVVTAVNDRGAERILLQSVPNAEERMELLRNPSRRAVKSERIQE